MPIEVEDSEAPGFLRWTITGVWPAIDALGEVRTRLIDNGQLTDATRVLIDLRNVENVPDYHQVPAMIQGLAPPEITVEIFFSDSEARQWLNRF